MKKILLLLLTLSIMAAATACAAEAQETPVVTATEIQKQSVEAFGVVISTSVKNITLDFQAPVVGIHIKDGEHVTAGQQLVSLDLTEMRNAVENKELSLAAAKNNVDRTLTNTDMKKLLNDQKNAQTVYNKSAKELEVKELLYTSGSISQNDLDSFRKLVDNDKKNLQDIQYAIENLKNNKGSESEQKSLETSILEADLRLLNSKLSKPYIKDNKIVSDVKNGIVYEIGYIQGDITNPQRKLLSILDLDSLEIEATIPEEFVKDVEVGSAVTIIPVADKSKKYTGKVSYMSGKAFDKNGETQVPVRILFDSTDEFLLPGFNVDVSIETGNATKN